MRILDDFPFEISAQEVFSRLHLDPHRRFAGEIHALIDRARPLARPRVGYEVAFVEERGENSVVIIEATPQLEQALELGSDGSRPPRSGHGVRPAPARGEDKHDS